MSAAAPPPPAESNPSEPKSEKKNRTNLPPRRTLSRRSGPPQSSKVATPAQEPTRKSFIWPWLEGKLEKKPSSFSSEGSSSSSPRVSDSVPVLAPMPVSAVVPQDKSNTLGLFADAATELVAVYDPFTNLWYYISLPAYNAIFGMNKEEKLPEEDKEVEENVKEENIEEKEVQVDLPKQMTPRVKTIRIGEIEVQVPLKDSEQLANVNPTGSASSSSSSSSNVRDGAAQEEADELPRVVEHGQQSGSTAGQKKGKKKKNKGKKK